VGYLAISYTIEKSGTAWKTSGTLRPMVARDGPHYADNVRMDGPGSYGATYLMSPGTDGFLRHVDKETGVPDWWGPFSETFASAYPQE